MTRRALDEAVTYREVDAHFEHHPNLKRIVRNGATVKAYGPTGIVIYHNHPGQQVKHGTLKSIFRMAVLAGLGVIVLTVIVTAAAVLLV